MGCPSCQGRKGTFIFICCCPKWSLCSSSHLIVSCSSGGEYKNNPLLPPMRRHGKRHTFWMSLTKFIRRAVLLLFFPLFFLAKAPLRLFLSGKMSGSGLLGNCFSICSPEGFPRWVLCEIWILASGLEDSIGFAFRV